MKLSLVIPAYNEAEIIEKSLKEIISGVKKITSNFEVIVVENGSKDNTLSLLKKQKLFKRIRIFHLPVPDLGSALKFGILKSKGEIVSICYPDLYNFPFIKKSINLLKTHDLVLGSKSKNTSRDRRSLKRKLISLSYNFFLRYFLRIKCVNSRGPKSFRKVSLQNIVKSTKTEGALFDTEIAAKAEILGLSIIETSCPLKEKRPSRLKITDWLKQTIPHLLVLKKTLKNYIPERPCPLCGSKTTSLIFLKDSFKISKCNNCSVIYTDKVFSKNFFKNYYDKSYFLNCNPSKKGYGDYNEEEDGIRKNSKVRLDDIVNHISSKGKVLDIGCATGIFLSEAEKIGFDPYGVEISNYARSIAQKRLGKNKIKNCLPSEALAKWGKFDVITLWDTIEHLEKPKETLEICRKLLTKNGSLAISTGDTESAFARLQGKNWHLLNLPQHLLFFSKKTLTRLLEESGFKIFEIKYEPQFVSLKYINHRLKGMYPSSLFSKAFSLITKIPFISSSCLPVNLHDIMILYAKKNSRFRRNLRLHLSPHHRL